MKPQRLARDRTTNANRTLAVLIIVALAALFLSNITFLTGTSFSIKAGSGDPASHWNNVLQVISWFIITTLLPWAALLALILHFLRRRPWSSEHPSRFFLLHFSVGFLFSLAQFLIHAFIEPDTGSYFGDFAYRLVLGLLDYLGRNIIFYAAVVAVHQALSFFRQLRQKEVDQARLAESLAEARLSSLKMKLQPHFLFNALQSINVLILDRQVEAASEMLSRLSILLRRSLDQDEHRLVTVEAELETVREYLAIEEIRFADRLQVKTTVESGVRNALVPGLILQPLIENAVGHGIARRSEPGRIEIDIRREGKNLILSVRNDGPSLPSGWDFKNQAGFGLQATRKRLELLYENDFELALGNDPAGGVRAEITIPFSRDLLADADGTPT